MTGIKPPSPPKIWRFSSAHFQRKVISETNNLWYNILEVIKGQVDHRERAEHKSQIGQSGFYLKNKSNLFLWQVQSGAPCLFLQVRQGTVASFQNPNLTKKSWDVHLFCALMAYRDNSCTTSDRYVKILNFRHLRGFSGLTRVTEKCTKRQFLMG